MQKGLLRLRVLNEWQKILFAYFAFRPGLKDYHWPVSKKEKLPLFLAEYPRTRSPLARSVRRFYRLRACLADFGQHPNKSDKILPHQLRRLLSFVRKEMVGYGMRHGNELLTEKNNGIPIGAVLRYSPPLSSGRTLLLWIV